jgi:hypothetical protein
VLAGGDPDVSTDNLVGIFHRIFADSWGPRTDDILRSALQMPKISSVHVKRHVRMR